MRSTITSITLALAAALSLPVAASAPGGEADWPRRVLITNDNGIDDVAIVELARALAREMETHVVAATTDRSGTSTMMSAIREGEFRVERRDLGEGIEAWALEGYPADCVVFALTGPLRERLPDLVVSGINGGPNLADAWLGSGTIGAARTAAYFGIPAVAISGIEDDDPEAVRAAVKWVVELVRSPAVRGLEPLQYLTVSLPMVQPAAARRVELVTRARGLFSLVARPGTDEPTDGLQSWPLELAMRTERAAEGTDVAAAVRGSIAIVPMRVDESDPELLALLRENPDLLPAWSPPRREATGEPRCRSGLGIVVDDAEDPSGREWGVLIEEVLAGGKAEQLGLRAGDVIVSLNGRGLAVPRGSREDPDELFLKWLQQLGCGDSVSLEYIREGKANSRSFSISAR